MSSPAETTPPLTPYRGRTLIRPTLVRRVKWRLETLGYAMFETALGGLPLAWVARVGRGLGAVAGVALGGRRRTVMRNLRIAFAGEKTLDELRSLAGEVFRRSGANLLGSLRTVRVKDAALPGVMDIVEMRVLHEAIARGRGVVVVLAHMGNWEALAQRLPHLLPQGVTGATVYRPLNNPIMNARVAALRKRRGLTLFSKDDNPLGMAGFLRRGGVLGVLADQRAGNIGEIVPFFGRLTSCTPIPAILARRTGAAIVGASLRTVANGRWELQFHPFEEATPTTAGVMKLVERIVRVSPADVFWLHERWRVSAYTPHQHNGKPARSELPAVIKRRRALLWAGEDGRLPPAPVAVPDDVDYEWVLVRDGSPPVSDATGAARARVHRYEGEGVDSFLLRLDEVGEQPLDYVVGGGEAVARACRRLDLGWMEAGA